MNPKKTLIKKSLPHNFLAEKIILNCLLFNSESIDVSLETLPIEAFYFKNHKQIYKSILFMYKYQLSIDIFSLTIFLQENGLLNEVGGIGVLCELINEVPHFADLEKYIKLVKEKFFRRSLIQFGYKVINMGYITNIPFEKILSQLEQELINLTPQNKNLAFSNNAESLTKIFFHLKKQFLNPTLPGVPSGFLNLDELTQGFQKSDLIVLAGRPSMGKTALSLNIALNVLKISKLPVLFFSLEMSKEQLMYRILASETGISQTRLKNAQLYKNDWLKLNQTIKFLSKLPFFIEDQANSSIQEIQSKAKKLISEQTEIGLIIIDYLQLVQNLSNNSENRVQELSNITRLLKMMARELNIPIIALSQLSRKVENRINQKPMLSDLRESGSIEQDSDLVLLLYSKKSNSLSPSLSTDTELIIAKHRNGPLGIIQFFFHKISMKFIELVK